MEYFLTICSRLFNWDSSRWIFFYSINENFLKILVAFFITFNVIKKLPTLNKNKMFLTGVISSFLSTIIGVTGSLISSVVQSFNLTKPEYISSCAFFTFHSAYL